MTSSSFVTRFSDYFPGFDPAGPYKHEPFRHDEYVKYLGEYATENDLWPVIHFGCRVLRIERDKDSRWQVYYQRADIQHSETFDFVAVCSGVHAAPQIPQITGLDKYEGKVMHSSQYRRPGDVLGQSVVFVGAGENGGDIVGEVSRYVKTSYLSLRRGVFVIPRHLDGWPNDYKGTRLLYSLPEFVVRRKDSEALRRRRRVGLALLPIRSSVQALALVWGRTHAFLAHRGINVGRSRGTYLKPGVESIIMDLRARCGGNQFSTFATKTEGFVEAVAEGRCEIRPGVKEVTTRGVVFDDGTTASADTILFCTGFDHPSAAFLDGTDVDFDNLYKHCFDPRIGESLSFIGFIRPPVGAIPPMAEMQARWFAQVASGTIKLPTTELMLADISEDRARWRRTFARVIDRVPYMTDFAFYMDDIAEILGCKPRLGYLVARPRLLFKVYTTPFAGVQFRLVGPHSRPMMARTVLLRTPSYWQALRVVDLVLAEVAGLLGSHRFAPYITLHSRSHNEDLDAVG